MFLRLVEKWDPVLGHRDSRELRVTRDLRDLWNHREPQYLRVPLTTGTPRTSGSSDPPEPQDFRIFGKFPLPFEIQKTNSQKL